MIISGIYIGSKVERPAIVQLQGGVVASAVQFPMGQDPNDLLGAVLGVSNRSDLTVIRCEGAGTQVFDRLRQDLPHKKIVGVTFTPGKMTQGGEFVWSMAKIRLMQDLMTCLANGEVTLDCLEPGRSLLESEMRQFQLKTGKNPNGEAASGAHDHTICALALACFARSALRELLMDPSCQR
jgi:hypothetical protein